MSSSNYFNFYTEIEEYFWRKRGAHLLVSPLDWALLETWQKSAIPVEAVLKGIDRAFESYGRSRRGSAGRPLKSLAYCSDAVLEAAAEYHEAASGRGPAAGEARHEESFSPGEIERYLDCNAAELRAASEALANSSPGLARRIAETAERLDELKAVTALPASLDLEDLERHLTVLEEKLSASLASEAPEDRMLEIRRDMDRALAPYRRKMDAAQIAQLERQYQQKRLYDAFRVPRLSLFYMT